MLRLVLIFSLIITGFSAQAFYTSLDDDISSLRVGIMTEEGTMAQKESLIKKLIPVVKEARNKAYSNVAAQCTKDLTNICPKSDTVDSKVKCLSKNKNKLSDSCQFSIQQNFKNVSFE